MLLAGDRPVSVDTWHSFWDSLHGEASAERRSDAVALLEALRSRVPDHRSVDALVESLDARRSHPPEQEAVNIVGSGGGAATFNLSTAAAIVAATLGVRVVKSGSRGYSSRYGSLDVLKLLGVPLARSDGEVADALERFGIAFPGPFVYPPELALLAKRIFPLDWRTLGSFVNRLGPFLAAVPATSQLTGVSDRGLLPLYEFLAASHGRRRLWLCANGCGVDELVSFETNLVRRDDGTELRLVPSGLGASPGSLADLKRAADPAGVVRQFTALVGGEGRPAAIESICLNAACMAVMSGVEPDWAEAFREARRAVDGGAAAVMLERLRSDGADRSAAMRRSTAAPAPHG
jgi:anthranilate phosphoribosyltransferase